MKRIGAIFLCGLLMIAPAFAEIRSIDISIFGMD